MFTQFEVFHYEGLKVAQYNIKFSCEVITKEGKLDSYCGFFLAFIE